MKFIVLVLPALPLFIIIIIYLFIFYPNWDIYNKLVMNIMTCFFFFFGYIDNVDILATLWLFTVLFIAYF